MHKALNFHKVVCSMKSYYSFVPYLFLLSFRFLLSFIQSFNVSPTSAKMFSKALISTALLPSLVYSQATNLNPGGAGCVDPSGYTSCYATSATNFGNCGQVCTQEYAPATKQFETCAAACSAANWATNIGCWLQSCWNRVYSCRYQGTAMQYIAGTDLEQTTLSHPIPYYPTPDGAPAACCSSPLFLLR
jgi:hypothetical protein